MSTVEYRFLEPLDVLVLRGNKLFGDPGSFGESLVPPWPSVAAGALRSRMLAEDRVDLAAFAQGDIEHPTLGTPARPGSFTVTAFHLARRLADGTVEALVQPPADLVISEGEGGDVSVRSLAPTRLPESGITSSAPLLLLPVLAEDTRGKPASGYWLAQAGWRKDLAGERLESDDLVKSSQLWAIDPRVGVGLDASTRRAADGRLFSVQAVAMIKRGHRIGSKKERGTDGKEIERPMLAEYDVGFLAGIASAEPPSTGTLRLGGDGRAAAIHREDISLAEPDYTALADARRCRLVLTSPGIFPEGWRPPGMDATGRIQLGEIRGRLVCAAVPRAETVSGWDLALGQPKAAQRAAPAGSVYWLDDLDATPEALRKLVVAGLWDEPCEDAARRAEGFNRLAPAAWK